MYKKTADQQSHLDRSANHSTKGSRRGVAPTCVPNEYDPVTASELRSQIGLLLDQYRKERSQIANKLRPEGMRGYRWTKNVTYMKNKGLLDEKCPERAAMFERYFELGQQLQQLQDQMSSLPAPKRFYAAFYEVAEGVLPESLFLKVMHEARQRVRPDHNRLRPLGAAE